MISKESKKSLIGKYILFILYALFILLPFVWILYSSFRYEANMFTGEFFTNEGGLTLMNYFAAIDGANFGTFFRNSLIIATTTTVIVTFLSLLGAYALSRFELKGKNGIILSLLSANMFPHVLLMIPFFAVISGFRLVDSYTGIIITHIILGLPFGIWLIKGYFDGVPKSLDDAAKIDGLGPLGTLFRVIIPVAAPGVVVAAFYAFMVSWGDFLFATIISSSSDTRTLPIGLANFIGASQVRWGAINAATIITVLPTIIIFAFLQKWIVEGLSSGAVKG